MSTLLDQGLIGKHYEWGLILIIRKCRRYMEIEITSIKGLDSSAAKCWTVEPKVPGSIPGTTCPFSHVSIHERTKCYISLDS